MIETSLQSGIALVIAIVGVTFLLLFRNTGLLIARLLSRALLRPLLRIRRILSRALRRALRLLGILPHTPQGLAARSAVVLSPGIARVVLGPNGTRAITGSTETDEAIAKDFDPQAIDITRHRQLFCTWLQPRAALSQGYTRSQAEADLAKARRFFDSSIPIESNPVSSHEDLESAFIVELFKDSDKPCFYILLEFRKTINQNIAILATILSSIIAMTAIANLTLSSSIDFYHLLNLEHISSTIFGLSGLTASRDTFNKFVFGSLSCFAAYFSMWFFYHGGYARCQRHNGQHMNTFLIEYLANIAVSFRHIHSSAVQTVVAEQEASRMKYETVLWTTILHWMSFRVFFIESYLKNILFQIHRSASYYVYLVPLLFISVLFGTGYFFDAREFNILDLRSELYHQNSFYFFFVVLLFVYIQYVNKSLSFIWESLETRSWYHFKDLNVHEAMASILDAYTSQLDRWRSVFKRGYGPPS